MQPQHGIMPVDTLEYTRVPRGYPEKDYEWHGAMGAGMQL